MSTMYVCHGVEEIPHKAIHGNGLRQPDSTGVYGGYPANTHLAIIKRNTNVLDLMKKGVLLQELDQADGKLEVLPAMIDTSLKKGDVYLARGMGGGGWGDPVERDPVLVANDVKNKLVSLAAARNIYGVVVNPEMLALDVANTEKRRLEIRGQRRSWKPGKVLAPAHKGVGGGTRTGIINEKLAIADYQGRKFIECRCGRVISPADENYKEYALFNESPIQKAGPFVNEYELGEPVYGFREYCCPGCFTLLDAEVALKSAPLLWDVRLAV